MGTVPGDGVTEDSARLLVDRERAARHDAEAAPGAWQDLVDAGLPTKADLDQDEALARSAW